MCERDISSNNFEVSSVVEGAARAAAQRVILAATRINAPVSNLGVNKRCSQAGRRAAGGGRGEARKSAGNTSWW